MQKEGHSDNLDFISGLNSKGIVVVALMVIVAALVLVGMDKTAYTVKDTNVKEITIFAEKWRFIPSEITVKHNQPVRLKLLTSEENLSFGFKLSRYMYNDLIIIEPNTTKYLEFNAYNKGEFFYRCESPCGFGKNLMEGRLIVE